ncbi:MAG: thiamine ABC transporter substrate-binding protein [Anaerolineae bacterium]|nr:thiamine ABC transporter substrate-binding protein [Anaerolineae bacterium]
MKSAVLLVLFIFLMSVPVIAQDEVTITLVTHDSFAVSEDILDQFQAETGITVQILRSGDAGAMVNQSILSRENPLGDVMFGVDNTFLGRALEAEIFLPYESALLADVPDEFKLDPENRVTPIDYGDVCLNYDVSYFAENDLPLPQSLIELTSPEYKGLLTVENPATSSPGLAFLLATINQFGTDGDYTYLDFWTDLVANDVYISDDWSDAYYNQFSGSTGSQGTRPLVVSYASSPPVEVYFMETPPETAPTASIIADGTCFRQIEFVGILAGTQNPEAAQQFVDFMLSTAFQEDMPLQMFVFPVNPEAELPEIFTQYAAVPESPVVLDADEINTNRETWIQAWTEAVLR